VHREGIIVEPRAKIRTPIDKKIIDHHCTNPEECPEQRNQVPNPPASLSEPTLEVVEKRLMRHILHLEDQYSALCRFIMQLYHAMRDKAYMDDEELSSYLNWPGDRPSSVGGRTIVMRHRVLRELGEMRKKRKKTKEVAKEAEATVEVAKVKTENVAANVEETIDEMVAEKVAKAAEENCQCKC